MNPRCLVRLGAAVAMAAALGGCAAGAAGTLDGESPSSAPPLVTMSVPAATATPGATGSTTAVVPAATPAPLPAAPPVATLAGLSGDRTAPGDVGSYTWGGSGSDGPWVVAPAVGAVRHAAVLAVAFGGAVPGTWTAAWARVAAGTAGAPAAADAGVGLPSLVAPTAPGDWSLRVSADFGPGHSAAYYWHLAVTP